MLCQKDQWLSITILGVSYVIHQLLPYQTPAVTGMRKPTTTISPVVNVEGSQPPPLRPKIKI
jgi:hypothetical protein